MSGVRDFFCGGVSCFSSSRSWNFGAGRTAGFAGLRAAALPDGGLHLDAGLLGLRRCRLLLGAGSLGCASASGLAVDAGILGLERGSVRVSCRLLGIARWFLWRGELWLRLWRSGIRWRSVAR